ncbi:hypothetical protein QUF58_00120 [Anaerolineales bacterium HSG24]|nr:hypothetical protein [Anaerolineales bacterium HSG24]
MSQKTSIYLILLLTLALHIHQLATDSFWGDEILTASFASQSVSEVIRWTAGDIHPPLYYLMVGSFASLLTNLSNQTAPSASSDWLWRFPSVIATMLTVALTYRLTFQLLRPILHRTPSHLGQIAVAVCLLVSLSPVVLKYSQEARMHALFMLLTVASTACLLQALRYTGISKTWWLAYAITTVANLYTVYFGFLILASQSAYVGARQFQAWRANQPILRSARIVGFGGAVALALLLYLPWGAVLLNLLRQRAAVGAIEGGVGKPSDFLIGVVTALGPLPMPIAWLFFGLFCLGLIILIRHDWPVALFAGLWFGLPTLLPILLGDPRALQFRYAFVIPIYMLVVVYSLYQMSAWLHLQGASHLAGDPMLRYLTWLLATLSFIAMLNLYQQTKPNWRGAAIYLTEHAAPADIILFGSLWDEGRFINYYYQGQAQPLTPASFVTNIDGYTNALRQGNGRVWLLNRFEPAESPFLETIDFTGLTLSKPTLNVYDPPILAEAALDLAAQAVEAAYPWAEQAEAQGTINPDPRTAQAGALRMLGDTLLAADRPAEAIVHYQHGVEIFPGWVGGLIALAKAHEQVGQVEQAARTYQEAVQFNLAWQGESAEQANQLVEAGDWGGAIAIYQQLIHEKK